MIRISGYSCCCTRSIHLSPFYCTRSINSIGYSQRSYLIQTYIVLTLLTSFTYLRVETFQGEHDTEHEIPKHKVKIYSFVMDAGSEFNNNAFNKHYANVKMYRKSPHIHNSTGIVERRNGYIRDVLQKYFTSYHTLKWVDVLQKINNNINNTYNRTIKHPPVDVWNRHQKNEQEPRESPTKYEAGDRVRLLIQTKDFEKKSTGRYSNEIHNITFIDGLGYRLGGIERKVFPLRRIRHPNDINISVFCVLTQNLFG